MSTFCSRLLYKDTDVEHFVENVLHISTRGKRTAINTIVEAERNLRGAGTDATTFYGEEFRDYKYKTEVQREQLRQKIVAELLERERLDNDDDIRLGRGGAKPLIVPKAEKKVFYVIGPPASGKSTVSNLIADIYGAYILDSDYAKRKLPEYRNQKTGASLVHEESDQIVFRYQKGNLMAYCVKEGFNMVIPKIGHSIDNIMEFQRALVAVGYQFFLISVDLDRFKATHRAYNRYRETKRYVPLSLVFDAYSNEPTLNYFRVRQRYAADCCGFAQISTDVPKDEKYILLEEENLIDLRSIFAGR